jgi:hypothetical protein
MKTFMYFPAFVALIFGGCNQANEVVEQRSPAIEVTFSHLPRLEEGEGHYQLWARFVIFNKGAGTDSPQHDSTAESLGEFNVSEDGKTLIGPGGVPVRFEIPADDNPQLIDDIIVTIQPETHHADNPASDAEPGPAFLGGKVYGSADIGVADLDESYSHALGISYANVAGVFSLMAPTSPGDSASGVWFVDGQTPLLTQGLRNLPAPPAGWVYEGWAIPPIVEIIPDQNDAVGIAYSTGRFLRADTSDFDGAGPNSGSAPGLNFPGQDFIIHAPGGPPAAADLRGWSFRITLEPEEDNSPNPFCLTILTTRPDQVPHPLMHSIPMENIAGTAFPRMRVTINRSGR